MKFGEIFQAEFWRSLTADNFSAGYLTGAGFVVGLLLLLLILIAVVLVWIFGYNRLLLTSLNEDLAAGKNIRVQRINRLFAIVLAVIVTISIKWVGMLIINSLLVLPAAAARNLAKNSAAYHGLSVGISLVSGVSGLILSYYWGIATGGTIVLMAAVIFFATFLFSRLRRG